MGSSKRPDPPRCEAQGGPGLATTTSGWTRRGQLTNAALVAWFGTANREKEGPGRAGALGL